MSLNAPRRALTRWLYRLAVPCVVVLPVFLMHGRGVADSLLSGVSADFLLASAIERDFAWTRALWMRVGLLWWAWLVLCSVPGIGIGGWLSFGHALAALRFLVFVAALQAWVLAARPVRLWLGRALTASALYIGLSAWLQFATGHDLAGWGRGPDGELTGPFQHPRAGAPLSRLLFPTLLPALQRLLAGAWPARLAGFAVAVLSVGTVVLIGQRMPALLMAFGLIIAGLMLRRLRAAVLTALVAGAALLGASVVISPPVWHREVQKFSRQMEHFRTSEYGLIYGRAFQIALDHPILGRGYAGFRNGCPGPKGGWYCNLHPHNHYLEAATDSGFPGLLLFCALIVAWLRALLVRLGPDPDPLRVGLFVGVLIQEWPLSSMSSFYAVELTGFALLLLGWGLAEARDARP
jgi:O-antigen ligase